MFNLTLRKKIFLSYFILFTTFVLIMFPFSNYLVKKIIIKSMDDQATGLIAKIHTAPDHDTLIRFLKGQKSLTFFRVGIITDEHKILYDYHIKRKLGEKFSSDYVVHHPEVLQAFKTGTGYSEGDSDILGQKFAYYAKTFDFHGKTYVLRTAFPFWYMEKLLRDFQFGFLLLSSLGLLLFSVLTWFAIHRLTRPIEQIIQAIKPYELGLATAIHEIVLKKTNPNDEFGRLAHTLNSLSAKIQRHIARITEERSQKEAILESLVEGVVAVDRDMHVTYVNHMALQLFGLKREMLEGASISITNQPVFESLLLECRSTGAQQLQSVVIPQGTNGCHLDLVAVPTKDHQSYVLVLQDKTAHHKMTQMRRDFVANASHELKTPITIIMGFAETLHDNPDLPKEIQGEITGKIVANTTRMDNIIKDLLILSDVENLPASRLDECNLYTLAKESKETVNTMFPTAQIEVKKEMEGEPILIGDPYLLELAINNLLNNAAKYSNPPATIIVTIRKVEDQLQLVVADRGIGIPEADIEFLFQRFYTVNKAHSRKLGGSGLGLSIVQTIVEKHGGMISVESELGVGTTFTVQLPIA